MLYILVCYNGLLCVIKKNKNIKGDNFVVISSKFKSLFNLFFKKNNSNEKERREEFMSTKLQRS